MEFGTYIRDKRMELKSFSSKFSLRKIAGIIDVEPAFLSKVERNIVPPPSERKIIALADALDEDPDFLLGLAGRISKDLITIVSKRPIIMAELLRKLANTSDDTINNIIRQI